MVLQPLSNILEYSTISHFLKPFSFSSHSQPFSQQASDYASNDMMIRFLLDDGSVIDFDYYDYLIKESKGSLKNVSPWIISLNTPYKLRQAYYKTCIKTKSEEKWGSRQLISVQFFYRFKNGAELPHRGFSCAKK